MPRTTSSRSPSAPTSSAATTLRRSKKTCRSPASSHLCPRPRWPPSAIAQPPSRDKPSSSTSKAAPGRSIYQTHQRTPGKRRVAVFGPVISRSFENSRCLGYAALRDLPHRRQLAELNSPYADGDGHLTVVNQDGPRPDD